MSEKYIISQLANRYLKLIGVNKDQHIRNMCLTIIDKIDTMNEGQMNRWIGYIQKSLIDYKLTTISKENNFSKLLLEKINTIPIKDVINGES